MNNRILTFFKKYYIYFLIAIIGYFIRTGASFYLKLKQEENQKIQLVKQKKLTSLESKFIHNIIIKGPKQINFVDNTGNDTVNFYTVFDNYKSSLMKDPHSDFEVVFEDMKFKNKSAYKEIDTLFKITANNISEKIGAKIENVKSINYNNKRIYEGFITFNNKKLRLLFTGLIRDPYVGLLYSISPAEYFKLQDSIIYNAMILYPYNSNMSTNSTNENSENKLNTESNPKQEKELLEILEKNAISPTLMAKSNKEEVKVGEVFQVEYLLYNKGEKFVGPSFQGFQVYSGPNQSSKINLKNGKMYPSVSYYYILSAKKEGTFFIGSASVISLNKKIESNKIKIKVKGK